MADIVVDGTVRVAIVATISDLTAPTTTELNAGVLAHDTLTPDGLMGFEADTAAVDTSALASTFNTEKPGRDSYSGMALQFKKQTGTDTLYTTLVKNTATNVVIRRDVDADTDWASDDVIEVYPVTCGQRSRITPAANEVSKWKSLLFLSADPELAATVA